MPQSTPGTSTRVKKATKLLSGVRLYVTENINKRLDIISEAWEVSTSLRNLSQWITTFMEYLQKDLEHDELFYKNDLSTFVVWCQV
jgi:hypothetical protein